MIDKKNIVRNLFSYYHYLHDIHDEIDQDRIVSSWKNHIKTDDITM